MSDILTDKGFRQLYKELEADLIDYLKEHEMDPDDFDHYISQMSCTVRTRMLLLDETAITGNQVYLLMKLPYDAMLKITEKAVSKNDAVFWRYRRFLKEKV